MTERVSLEKRLQTPVGKADLNALEVLNRRIPFFFQGVAAQTGLRHYRENLDCWSRWEDAYYQENSRPSNGNTEWHFRYWIAWGSLDMEEENDPMLFTRLLLEPMYWLEKCAKMKE